MKMRNGFALSALNRKGGMHEETEKSFTIREGCFDCGSPSIFKHGLCRNCLTDTLFRENDEYFGRSD